MVDVGEKPLTRRRAVACASIAMQPGTLRAITRGSIGKGDVLAVARVAGVQAAKRAAELIPLCHPLPLDVVSVEFDVRQPRTIVVRATAEVSARTGVEMEALTAAAIAALTIYDMCKAVDRGMTIGPIRLEEKSGGRSGVWRRPGRK